MPLLLAFEVGLLAIIEERQAVVEQLVIKVDGINSPSAWSCLAAVPPLPRSTLVYVTRFCSGHT